MYSQQAACALNSPDALPLCDRLPNAAISYVLYLWKMLWPVNLAIFYPHTAMIHKERLFFIHTEPTLALGFYFWGAAAACLLLAITALAIAYGRRRPYLIVGWFWFLVAALPTIGLVQVGIQAMADRYTYIPSIGVAWLVVWGLYDMAARRGRFALGRPRRGRRDPDPALPHSHLCPDILVEGQPHPLRLRPSPPCPTATSATTISARNTTASARRRNMPCEAALIDGKNEEAAKLKIEMDFYRDQAIWDFKKTIAINPIYDFGHNNLGVCYARRRPRRPGDEAIRAGVASQPELRRRLQQLVQPAGEAQAVSPSGLQRRTMPEDSLRPRQRPRQPRPGL